MAGGPIFPYSKIPVTDGVVFPVVFTGAGSGPKQTEGMGVLGAHATDGTWRLRFAMPPTLPSGTAKVRLWVMSNAETGDEDVDVQWASVAMGEDPSSATLVAEGNTNFLWGSGEEDEFKEGVVTLGVASDADVVTADEIITMDLVFKAATSNLAALSCWQAYIFWE